MFNQPKDVRIVTHQQRTLEDWFPCPFATEAPFKELQQWINLEKDSKKTIKLDVDWNVFHANRFRRQYQDMVQSYLETVWSRKFPNQYSVKVQVRNDAGSHDAGSGEDDGSQETKEERITSSDNLDGLLPAGIIFHFDDGENKST